MHDAWKESDERRRSDAAGMVGTADGKRLQKRAPMINAAPFTVMRLFD
jgi:hypothetical protein